jgi:DNA-binding transcriptional LysR family regulator
VAIVPRMCAERELASGDLRELKITQMRVTRKLYLVYRRDRALSAAAQGMLEVLRAKAAPAGLRRPQNASLPASGETEKPRTRK